MSDSTDRHNTQACETALRHAEAQFALAEKAARIGAWRMDLSTGTVTCSAGLYAIMGLDPTRMNVSGSQWLLDLIRPDDVAAMNHEIANAIAERRPFHYRARSREADAPASVIDTHGEVEFDANDKPVALIAVARDVSDIVDADNARIRAEKWYRCVADQASDIILLYNARSQIIFASDALDRVLKRKPEEIAESRFLDIVHPDDINEARKMLATPEPGATLTATFRARHSDGHYLWMECTSRAIYDDKGALQNIISVTRDITERKRREAETTAARDEAVNANIAKSTFLANMSHELRTPLNAIIGFAEIMRRQMFGPLGSEQYKDYARLIHESGELLLELISDILDMAKIEAGKLDLHIETIHLKNLVDDCLRLIEERAKQNEIAIITNLSAEAPELRADRRALKQILLNLLSNAVKFTMPGGCIAVRTVPERGGIALSVQDDGVGIPAEDLPRLGKPFEQARTDATLSAGGAGLGLALVRALAEKHGGTMTIESEEGFGTTVTVLLPLDGGAQEEAA